jgi:hypothetical protein
MELVLGQVRRLGRSGEKLDIFLSNKTADAENHKTFLAAVVEERKSD